MLSIKRATTQNIFNFLTLKLDFAKNLFQEQNFSVKRFAYAKFG